MRYLSRVVWSEGMYLGPHHFQVQSRYFEDSIRFATETLWYESYGLVAYELDAEALRNGTASLIHARGIFPDGLVFNMPESDLAPPVRPVADHFPPSRDHVTVLLGIPPRRQNGLNCNLPDEDGNGATRFTAETALQHDETTGRDEKPVRMGRKNIRLYFDTEPNEELMTIPLARVRRDGSGHFIYDPAFIPPCVRISASERLMMILRRLIEVLDEKAATIFRGRQLKSKSWAEYSTTDIASFWLLHTVNSALAPLRHIFLSKHGHPEELFREMSRLGGALCTFALESHPRSMPIYDHKHLDECFEALDRHIRLHLNLIIPRNVVSIPLRKVADYFYEGDITDQRVLDNARWVFAIRSPVGEVALITGVPRLAKICSSMWIRRLVERALPGMGLIHQPVPPREISVRADVQYFTVSKEDPCWGGIVKTRQVGVYVPGELPNPEIELLVILDS